MTRFVTVVLWLATMQSLQAQEWTDVWSPFRPLSDVPRHGPQPPHIAVPLLFGPARVGELWTAGNPAGAAWDVRDAHTSFLLSYGREDGAFRRPLDPEAVNNPRLAAVAWRPVRSNIAAVGRLTLEQQRHRPGSNAAVAFPYGTSPLVPTDSSSPPTTLTRARLEGLVAWRFDQWSFGLSLGYESWDNRTRETPVPRIGRRVAPAGAFGIVRAIGRLFLLGLHVRGRRTVETVTINPLAGTSTVHELDGFSDPEPIPVIALRYRRRITTDERAAGTSATGSLGLVHWTAYGRKEWRDQWHSSLEQENPPVDAWRASGITLGGALQYVASNRIPMITVHASRTSISGHAERADLDGTIFRASERVTRAGIELRSDDTTATWAGAIGLTITHESRFREDFLVQHIADLSEWTPGATVEIVHRFETGTSMAVAGSLGWHSAVSRIPDPATLGPIYQQLIAPELALYAQRAYPWLVRISVRQRLSTHTSLLVSASHRVLRPASTSAVPAAPGGLRRSWHFLAGLVL